MLDIQYIRQGGDCPRVSHHQTYQGVVTGNLISERLLQALLDVEKPTGIRNKRI